MKHIFYLIFLLQTVTCADILFLQPFGSQSQKQPMVPIARELGLRGHQVTFISTFSFANSPPENVTEIVFPQFQTHFKELQNILFETATYGYTPGLLKRYYNYHVDLCNKLFETKLFQNWISSKKKFKLVIADGLFNDCVLPVWRYLGESVVLVNSCLLSIPVLTVTKIPTPFAHIPIPTLPFTHQMDFFQRAVNAFHWTAAFALVHWSQDTFTEHVTRSYFPDIQPFFQSMENVSLVLTNEDAVLTSPRPYLPTVVRIGGIQCRPPYKLPEGELKNFADNSGDDGFIIFSFGTFLDGKLVSDELKNIFVQAFARIKQRVIWKHETELDGLSKNVMIRKWLPQQDLLGHPKIRAFISHGGMLSLQEAIYHAVPLICFPITTDQPHLVARAESLGIAIKLDPNSVTVEELVSAINKATKDADTKRNVLYYSQIFREDNPLQKAIFWIEYVMRYNGALHLQSASSQLNFFQYFLLDVIAMLLLIIVIMGIGARRLFSVLLSQITGQTSYSVKILSNKKNNVPRLK